MSFEIKNLSNLSLFPQFKYEKYEGKVIYQGHSYYVLTGHTSSTILERIVCVIKALVLTILTCGIALFFSQVRELWKNTFVATRQITVYEKEEKLSESIKMTIYNNWNTKDLKPVSLNTKLTKEEAKEMLRDEIINIEDLPSHLKYDPSFIDRLDSWHLFFTPASDPLFNHEDFMLEAIKINPEFITKASKELRNKKDFLSKIIEFNKTLTQLDTYPREHNIKKVIPLPSIYADDQAIILEWMSARVDTFNHISETLKQNESFVKQLKVANPLLEIYLKCRASESTHEKELLSMIEKDPTGFNLLSESLQSNSEFLIKAAQSNIKSFQHFPPRFKNDPNFVLKLIENLSVLFLLRFVHMSYLQTNAVYLNTVVVEKIAQRLELLPPLPYKLENKRDFWLKLLDIPKLKKADNYIIPQKFINDEEFVLKWIKSGITDADFRRISFLRQDPAFIKKASAIENSFSFHLNTTAS